MSSDFQSFSPGRNESGKQTFEDARSRGRLENAQQEKSSQCVSWVAVRSTGRSQPGAACQGKPQRGV